MELKKKLVSVGCAAVLASMMAAPAFAAEEGYVDIDGPSAQGSKMEILATVSDSTNLIRVTLPTVMPINIMTNPAGAVSPTPGSFAGAKQVEAPIENRSIEVVTNETLKVKTTIGVPFDGDASDLLADVNLYISELPVGEYTANNDHKLAKGSTKDLVEVPAATYDPSDDTKTIVTPGSKTIALNATDNKAGSALAILGANKQVSASVQTMITVTAVPKTSII